MMPNDRKNCPYRHENGNCLPVGGFCTAVSDEYCEDARKKNDFVSRQWLIDEYHRRHEGPPGGALKMIEEAPAAYVEPKREIAPWKVAGAFDDFHQCTKCGNMWPIFSTVEWAYCPVCGFRKFPEPPKED